ncbi:MAG: hypothetical protein R3C14_16880 [Caldilineaceae bacterium]
MASDIAQPQAGLRRLDQESVPDQADLVSTTLALPALWRDGFFWLTLCLTIFAVAPFLLPGYFWGANDARHHVYFLFEYNRSVQDGIWWPRWSPDFAFGYGYPFFNIYGLFSHFLAELLLHFLHFDYTAAVKTVFGLSIVGSAATMYLYIRSWQGRAAAVLAALVYVYIPYHLLNLYVRANLAESMAFLWLPLCLWSVRQAIVQPRYRYFLVAAISYAGLLLTSNLVFVLFTPLLGLYLVVLSLVYSRPKSIAAALPWWQKGWAWVRSALLPGGALLAGLGLGAVFLIPMLLERGDVLERQWFDGRYDFHGHFIYFFQLFSPTWGFGVSEMGPDDRVGFQIGVAALGLAVMGVLLLWPALKHERWEILCFVVAGITALLVGLQWSIPLWELPGIGTILRFAQFPWRWFNITALCVSVLSGLLMHERFVQPLRRLNLPLLTLIALILLSSYPYLKVEIKEPAEGPVSLAALMRFQQSSDEMTGSTRWVTEVPKWSDIADNYISQDEGGGPVLPVTTNVDYTTVDYENLVVDSVAHNTIMEEVWFCTGLNKKERSCTPRNDQRIVYNRFYYPGWRAYLLDGKHGQPVQELQIVPEETGVLGRITVPLPPVGEGYLLLRFEDTMSRIIGKRISLTMLALLMLGLVWSTRRKVF